MTRKRKAIPLEQQLAAALVCLLEPSLRDAARAARLPARSIVRMFTNHHLDFHALGGADKWWNLHPMTRSAHDERFGRDAAAIAKVKRLRAGPRKPRQKIPQRKDPWPKRCFRATRKPNVRQIADGR